ncbi:alkylhydroperoxidase AhpD family core domain-containing protein [Actinopolyspora lacussalsi subsp. righensis]|uniref:Alkylhydroperoxidase AhpD family core domain-containing protein n=1 Tax=Actinopolyspora righensis TaxID=995060 RepID=A0A1I6XD32_9ACTN|nr:carboxymuconolactone decarboxylase family protein [Actinopolyspora righensis]SFT35942.1 alkylhydroperoxidase AhpD family core domain-containing protein [Actinopolyspora righensis]
MTLIRAALRRSQSQIRHVEPVRPDEARGVVAEVYDQVERDFGMLAPPVSLHSPAPDVLAAAWMMLRETLLTGGNTGRELREAVATAVSRRNVCPYCIEVHGSTLDALVRDDTGAAENVEIGMVTDWVRGSGGIPPGDAGRLAELTGVAVTFQYLNRMVHVFLGESPLPQEVPAVARKYARRVLGRFLLPSADALPSNGASLDFLPAATLPGDLSWAEGSSTVADAFARASTAVEKAGVRALSAPVREVVLDALWDWDGQLPGPSRSWVEPLLSGVSGSDRTAGRLALLTAIAPYQVDDDLVREFALAHREDRTLVEGVAWASLAAARRSGELLSGGA